MAQMTVAHDTDERGMTTIQYVAATAMSLFVFVMMANFIVFFYARGAARAAVDEAARTGGRNGTSISECEARARETLDGLINGSMRAQIQPVHCSQDVTPDGVVVHASTDVHLVGWIPGVIPDWAFTLRGQSVKERSP